MIQEGLTFDDVLIVPGYSTIRSRSESECDTATRLGAFDFSIPICSANMDTITDSKMAKAMAWQGGLGIFHRYMSVDEARDRVSKMRLFQITNSHFSPPIVISVGTVDKDKERIDVIIDSQAEGICVDIAHGHSIQMAETLDYIRGRGYKGLLIAGNVATRHGAVFLKSHGADVVKVGVGPGSVCTTRIKTGCGVPQLTAILNCSRGWDHTVPPDINVIADGGIRTPGDAAKALAAGARAVMIGGMLAGTDCVPGWIQPSGVLHERKIIYRGMASKEAREAFTGQEAINAEGISTTVHAKAVGSTEQVIKEITEGIRSAMSYVGASNLDEFHKRATFIRVTPATVVENSPHFKS